MDKSNYRRNAKFLNKPKLKPIRARDVHVRHQIFFIDMSKNGSVKMNEHLYRYDLTVIDAFSRFLWLRTLESKSSQAICKWIGIYLYEAWIARNNPARPWREVQESLEITLRSREYKIDLQSPAPSPITRQGRTLPQDTKTQDGIWPSKKWVKTV